MYLVLAQCILINVYQNVRVRQVNFIHTDDGDICTLFIYDKSLFQSITVM